MSLKYRLLVILALIGASFWALFPRTVVERVKRNGEFVYDTVRRVPLKRGLDLQGGMHLALEVDESKGPVPDKSKAIDNALKVVRNRIDEFGVSGVPDHRQNSGAREVITASGRGAEG